MYDEFTIAVLTAMINNADFYVPGQIGQMGLFEEEGVPTTTVRIEIEDGVLSIIEPTARGGAGSATSDGARKVIPFDIDHFPIEDVIKADEVQGVRLLGSDDTLETLQDRINKKLRDHARRFDVTLEHQRIGALKGLIVSGKGRVLHDLYSRFDLPVPAAIDLGMSGGQISGIASKIQDEVAFAIEEDLGGTYDHIHAFAGVDYMKALWEQDEVRESYLADRQGAKLRDGMPDKFSVGMVTFERYRTGRKATKANGDSQFIAPNEARAFPVGVNGLFITRFGPADLEDTVNTVGLPRYSHQYPMVNGKGRHLDSQMNQISLCTQPGVLKKLTL